MNAEKACALIDQHGLHGLREYDGCPCIHFNVHGIEVSVSCHKSDHCIRVSSHHLDRDGIALESVMRAVIRSLEKYYGDDDILDTSGYRLRFCDYGDDHHRRHDGDKWVESRRCCYCHKHRAEPEEYLCIMCRQNEPLACQMFPWTKDGFLPGNSVAVRRSPE